MNNLKQPNKGDKAKAVDIRAMVVSIIRNNVTAGLGLSEQNTPNGKIISLKQQPRARGAFESAVYPRAFDIKSISAGTMTLTRCHFQIQSQYFTLDTEPTLTIANGVVCAIVNTATNPVTVTAAMNYVWTAAAPNLMPMALYNITVSTDGQAATVTCDRRGSIIIFHE
jgi:hypothetical protein